VTGTDPAELLPHRWPMLLLDEVVAAEPGVALIARRMVSAGDPWCGPGGLAPYLVLESWLQACAALLSLGAGTVAVPLVGALRGVRVARAVHPGEMLEHRVFIDRSIDTAAIFSGLALVDGETVLAAEHVTITITRRG